MFTGMLHTHVLVVSLFLILYLIKTFLLVIGKHDMLDKFVKKTKVPEMIISTLFLLTGIYLAMYSGQRGAWLWVKLFVVACSIPLAVIAFKKKHNASALLSLMFLVYAYGISETKSPFVTENKPFDTAGLQGVEAGKAIYVAKCIQCHGDNGKLKLSGAKDLTISALSHDEKIAIVTNGKNAMMSYKKQLTQQQIDDVVAYVETLKAN